MMKKARINPYILVMTAALLLFGSGCSEDFFDRDAGDRITPDDHWKDIWDGQVSWIGALSPLQETMPKLIILDGLLSDMMDVTPNAGVYLNEINNHNVSEFNTFNDPSGLYKVIINLNECLVHLDELAAEERELDDYTTFVVRGELLAMRAWSYFTLARLYGEVLYLDNNMETLPEDFNQWKGQLMPKQDIIDTLINQVLPYIYDPTVGIEYEEYALEYYVNPKGLLGEMYLEKGDYANAVTYLKMACESYGNQTDVLKVEGTYEEEAWETIFLNAESNFIEVKSVIAFNSNEDQYNPLARWFGYNFDYVVKPTQILVDTFTSQIPASGDPGDQWRGLGVTFGVDTLPGGTANYITKYEIDEAEPFSSDIIIQRAADLHLLLAEAYNRLGGDENQDYAMTFLNYGINATLPKPPPYTRWSRNVGIRGRVTLEERVLPAGIAGDAKTRLIEDLILTERAMELAYEGKRYFDLIRVAERRGDPAYIADKVAAKFEGTSMYGPVRNKLLAGEWYLPLN